jgi:hypothetical protein
VFAKKAVLSVRGAEALSCNPAGVTLGILCSGAISALAMRLSASTVFAAGLRRRDAHFKAFTGDVLERNVGRSAFEQRFAAWVDETIALDAAQHSLGSSAVHLWARGQAHGGVAAFHPRGIA